MVNYNAIGTQAFDIDIDRNYYAIFCLFLFAALCFVRKIEIFAITHVFADAMIVLALVIIVIYGCININDNGRNTGVPFINEKTYTDAIGFSVYAFEGIGIILPVQDITKNQEQYKSIVVLVIVVVSAVYIAFGYFCVNAWGTEMTTPLITDQLPEGWVTYIILFLFSLNLIFSYPLVLYPAHIIIENIIYTGMPKSRKRQMLKNNSRSLLVFFTCCLTIMLGDKLDKFLSILGALTCTPIAFTFPALFHLKAVAETTVQKVTDILLIVVSLGILVYCTWKGLSNWNDEDEKPLIDYSKVGP